MNDENKHLEPEYEIDDYDVDQENEEFIIDYDKDRSDEPLREGLKDKIGDFIKNNLLYVILIVVLIVPAAWQLKRMFAAPPEKQELSYDTKFTADENGNVIPNNPVALPQTAAENQSVTPTVTPDNNPNTTPPQDVVATSTVDADFAGAGAAASQTPAPTTTNLTQANLTQVDNTDLTKALNQENVSQNEVLEKITQLDDRLSKLEAMQAQISALATNVTALQASLTDSTLDDDVKILQNNINLLGDGMSQLSKIVYQQGVTQQAQAKSNGAFNAQNRGAIAQKDDFIVFATIPGRAWLRNRDGALVTVREGDSLPGYGRVTNINPIKGTVSLDSQMVFKENDNE